MLYEIKNRFTGSVIFSLECESIKHCVEAAVRTGTSLCEADLSGADLSGANLYRADLGGADLSGADLSGANLGGADLIDAGQDRRGYRFWAWRSKAGRTMYRAGCHEWLGIDDALAWYDESYESDGDRHECLARLVFLRDEAARRWPAKADREAA